MLIRNAKEIRFDKDNGVGKECKEDHIFALSEKAILFYHQGSDSEYMDIKVATRINGEIIGVQFLKNMKTKVEDMDVC